MIFIFHYSNISRNTKCIEFISTFGSLSSSFIPKSFVTFSKKSSNAFANFRSSAIILSSRSGDKLEVRVYLSPRKGFIVFQSNLLSVMFLIFLVE